jgi:ABC-2 type transport system ATP-binding protein
MIAVKNLFKKYGTNKVLNNINIEFDKGKVYGIVGENGAGKTTLFRCIAGLEEYEGEINSNLTPLKNHLGLLLTEPFFFQKITGKEYIQLLCNARNVKISSVEDRNIFDLPLNQYASTYSTGMKKKLALTAILLQGNEYFILDEPFNGVDIQSNLIITQIIHQLKALGKTAIISSHIFSTLSDTCDEIHLLSNGRFIKSVKRTDFHILETEMKQRTIGNKIEKLGLT